MKLILKYKGSPMKRTLHLSKDTNIQYICDMLPHDSDGRLVLEYKGRTLNHRATLQTAKITSGATIIVVTKRPKRPKRPRVLTNETPQSNDPCMITLESKWDRALMTCGHAISPDALFQYLNSELASGNREIRCPYTDDTSNLTPCNKLWQCNELQEKTCLSSDENVEMRRKLRINTVKFEKWRNKNIRNAKLRMQQS